ncbi:MAG: YihA family ribosome biogenesis GTP-binding protein [Deltaproteobacteria bacterium]|nr:YihA family ribosome biogenesis GTP-binding protein [Deltaproteobacteria bacterium]
MKIKSASFIVTAVRLSQYPSSVLPEIAFAGRSNVGKSALINKLLNRKKLVKTSSTPGRTQCINFFLVNDAFYFVDLPGYGYAKVPANIQKKWGPMVEQYLKHRKPLRSVILILDIRRIPNKEDLQLLSWLQYYNIPAPIVLTKADKLTRNKQYQQTKKIASELALAPEELVVFSSKSGQGKELLWKRIESLLR